jgi:hypothetical protein
MIEALKQVEAGGSDGIGVLLADPSISQADRQRLRGVLRHFVCARTISGTLRQIRRLRLLV